MRKFLPFFFALSALILSSEGLAQEERVGVHGALAYYSPAEEDLKAAFGSDIGTDFRLTGRLWLSVQLKYGNLNVRAKNSGLLPGEINFSPLLVALQYYLVKGGKVSPYLFLGGGYFFSRLVRDATAPLPPLFKEQKVRSGLGFHGGVGGTIPLSGQFSLFVEAFHLYRKAKAETVYFPSVKESFTLNLGGFSLLFGVKYFY